MRTIAVSYDNVRVTFAGCHVDELYEFAFQSGWGRSGYLRTEFRLDFLDRPDNRLNVCGSKAVGEPPLLLAVSVWAAVKQALATRLALPATNEEILRRLTERTEPSPERNGDRESRLRLSGVKA